MGDQKERNDFRKPCLIAAAVAAGLCMLLCLFHRTQILWPAQMLDYSGYTAQEHAEEFALLPNRKWLYSDLKVNEDASLSIYVTALQRCYYIRRYRRMLEEAVADAAASNVTIEVSRDCRCITYYAERYQDYFNAVLAVMRAEAMVSCLQAEKNRAGTDWSLRIRIAKASDPARFLADFTLPDEETVISEEMWKPA